MKNCPACGEVNPDDATICDNCGLKFDSERKKVKDTTLKGDKRFSEKIAASITSQRNKSMEPASKEVDIMFVFDSTGSMKNEIRAMQDAIIGFASDIKSEGLSIQLGLIEFKDRIIGEESKLFSFSDGLFTADISQFQKAVDGLVAKGGGPEPESSPDALMLALEQPFRECSNKVIVLITDAPPRIPDKDTSSYEIVTQKMKDKNLNQIYIVTMLQNSKCHKHLELIEAIQKMGGDGLAFELSKKDEDRKEHFKKVLKGLARSISTKSTKGLL
jgi:Mg-chelatase subunit ChlD